MRSRPLLLSATVFALIASVLHSRPSFSIDQDRIDANDWTIRAISEPVSKVTDQAPSSLQPVEKLTIDYFAGDNENTAVKYEKLWYHQGHPISMERLHKFEVKAGEGVCIKVKHKNGNASQTEMQAVADMVMRIWLDARLNRNPLRSVTVPSQSFQGVMNHLQTLHCVPREKLTENGSSNIMSFLLETENEGQRVSLYYK